MSLSTAEKSEIIQAITADPVLFCTTVLGKIFTGNIPYIHRALLALYTRRTKFLWKYGEVWKIQREFWHKDSEDQRIYPLFQFYFDGEEIPWEDWEQLKFLEESLGAEVMAERCKIQLQLGKYTAIVIPRGFAKTTVCGFAVPLYFCLLQIRDFLVYISESGTHSDMCVNNIRAELGSNEVIKELFGELVPERSDSSKKWTESLFETTTGFAMAARGSGSQIRGLNHKSTRPQIEFWDDLQSRDDANSETQRKKLLDWAYQDAMPALPELDPDATIIALGTLLSRDCFLVHILDDPEWTVVRLSVENEWGEYIWPENVDRTKDLRKRASYARMGRLVGYYLEYRSQIIAEEAQKFQKKYFIYQPMAREDAIGVAIYCDPAISDKTSGDYAVIQVGLIGRNGVICIVDEWRDKGLQDMSTAIIDNYFRLAMKWRPNVHGFEGNGFQAALETPMRTAMFHKRYYFEVEKVTNTQAKNARIMGNVHPLHRSGHLHFAKKFPLTEGELLGWQLEVKDQPDDGPDCLAGVVKSLHEFVGGAIDPGSAEEEREDEDYDDLEIAMGLDAGQDWRPF